MRKKWTHLSLTTRVLCSVLLSLLFVAFSPFSFSASALGNGQYSLWGPVIQEATISPSNNVFSTATARNVCFKVGSGASVSFDHKYYVASFSVYGAAFTPVGHGKNSTSWGGVDNTLSDASMMMTADSGSFNYDGGNPFQGDSPTTVDFTNRYIYTLKGTLDGSSSDGRVCWGNDSAVFRTTSAGGYWSIYTGVISIQNDLEVAENEYLSQIAQNTQNLGSGLSTINNSINSQKQQQHSDAQAQKEQDAAQYNEQMEGMADAQSDASTGSSSSGQQAQNRGSTLLQAFTSFVNAITSASPSNCVINADIGDFEMGNVDLCSLSPPPAVQTISSILLIGFCVPLSLSTARKMISLYRSFQT